MKTFRPAKVQPKDPETPEEVVGRAEDDGAARQFFHGHENPAGAGKDGLDKLQDALTNMDKPIEEDEPALSAEEFDSGFTAGDEGDDEGEDYPR